MPQLVVFLIKNFATGGVLGLAVAGWLVVNGTIGSHLQSSSDAYLATAMLAYSMASTFGIGFLATALWFSE